MYAATCGESQGEESVFRTLTSAAMFLTLFCFELFIPHSAESMSNSGEKTRERQQWKN
jgi:hypothetical protein